MDWEPCKDRPSLTGASNFKGRSMDHFFYAARPLVLDLATTLFFYLVLTTTHSVPFATGCGIALGLGQVLIMRLRGMPIARLQWTSLLLVMVMGGLTLITHDARFVLVKATVVYVAIGATMLEPGWMYRYIPPIAVDRIPRPMIVGFGYVWAMLIFGTGILNLYLTFTNKPEVVAKIMAIWAIVSKIVLFLVQFFSLRFLARRSYHAAAAGKITANPG